MVRKELSLHNTINRSKKYKGGDLVIYESRNRTKIEREQGLLVVFLILCCMKLHLSKKVKETL